MPHSNTEKPSEVVSFALAESQDIAVLFPLSALRDIKDYRQRVEPGEEEPSGEDPITGALSHVTERLLPRSFSEILQSVEAANRTGKVVVGFNSRLSSDRVTLEMWSAPRVGFDCNAGYLGTLAIPNTPAGARIVAQYFTQTSTVLNQPAAQS